jgi:protein SCO1/2
MRRRIIGYSIFFLVLIFLFLVVVLGNVRGPKDLFASETWYTFASNFKSKSPAIGFVKPFSFITQDGKVFTEKDMSGKVCVVNFFFTSCKGVCPVMNNNLDAVYNEFKNEKNFLIVSHTCDPETDSAARLKHYADSMRVDTHKWVFLTGRKDSLYIAARNNYLIDDPNNNVGSINDQFLHSQFIALVDKNGNVRGQVYDALKPDELKLLRENISALLREKSASLPTATGTSFAN